MGLQVRDARITDVDRITTLLDSAQALGAAAARSGGVPNLLRQLVYLPNAAVIIVLRAREVLGAAVLALRPSVSQGGLIGTIDVLVVDDGEEHDEVADVLLNETVRSARNKGCVAVEAPRPADAGDRERLQQHGFTGETRRIVRLLAPAGVSS